MRSISIGLQIACGLTLTMLPFSARCQETQTYTYDALGRLVEASKAGGPSNNIVQSFQYDKAGNRSHVNVISPSIHIVGTTGNDTIFGSIGDDYIEGGDGIDLIRINQGGHDVVYGGDGDDGILVGSALDDIDYIDGGPGSLDQLGLQGNYVNFVFGAQNLINIEMVVLLPGNQTTWGDFSGAFYSYNLSTVDLNVPAGGMLMIQGNTLRPGENITFNGSAETDGRFRIFAGAGDDVLRGGAGNDSFNGALGQDTMTGGTGNDTYTFGATAQSPPTSPDVITDYTAGDVIDLSSIDANSTASGNQAFVFIGTSAFTSQPGQVRVTGSGANWVLQADTTGSGSADFAVLITTVGGYVPSASGIIL